MISNLVAVVTKTRIISLCIKTKDYCFLTTEKVHHQVFLKMVLPAVIIKLYCFKSFFEKRFCSNNRLFVFSITENCFDFGCRSNEI